MYACPWGSMPIALPEINCLKYVLFGHLKYVLFCQVLIHTYRQYLDTWIIIFIIIKVIERLH